MQIREVIRTGFIARWLARPGKDGHFWGALTLPWRGITIYFWVTIDPEIRRHEYAVHVAQIERMGGLKYLASYIGTWLWLSVKLRSFRRAYDEHPMEQEP